MSWMQRLKRVFHIDIVRCDVCGGTLRVIACIETTELIETILTHLAAREAHLVFPGFVGDGRAGDVATEPFEGIPVTGSAARADPRLHHSGGRWRENPES